MVSKKVRTFAVPFTGNTYSFTMEYEYDSWGRILKMTYPDGEEVSYDYDHSGNLFSMAGVKISTPYHYINSILYDRFGNRSRTDYGDQSHTEYIYDDLQRLTGIRTTAYNAGSEVTIQDIEYTFDNVGNISDVDNNTTATGTLGGSYSNHYEYDDLDRLIYSTQSYGTGNTLSAAYSGAGRLCEKEQSHTGQSAVFGYDNNRQPHAPRRIFDIGRNTLHDILWDRNGNMGQANTYDIGDGSVVSSRQLFWTEDNRLASVVDDHYFSYYTYDHSGERVLKMTGTNSLLDINADLINYNAHIDNITLYRSPYLVANNHGYTKHYYAGTERVCARLGNGNLDCHSDFIGGDANMVGRHEGLFFSVLESMPERWLYYNNLENIGEGCGNTIAEILVSCEKIGTSARVETAAKTANFKDAMAQHANITQQTEYAYFYHGDHLGSASWITDDHGIPVQHLQYLPFGEPFVNQRASGSNYNERFTFTGKERDEETGFSYFGARYYDSDLSGLFLSVDPMSDKYPNISPYIYCAWNPIRFADPDGNERIVVSGGEYDGERYKYNFIEPAITKLKELKATAGSEPITWLVASAGYSESDMADFKRVANELGVGFQTINSADEFTNYLNSKDVGSSGLSKARMSDQITSISVFGLGYSGSVEFAHGQENCDQFSWGTDKVKKLNGNAFYNAKIDFYSCNSATDTETERSLGYVFSQRTKTIVTGYKGKSTYTQMNNGEGFGAKWNRFWNGFNTNGSVKLPQAGMGAVKVKFLPPKGK